jgi:hypothetical protein
MTLQEEIVFDQYFRCYAIGRKHVHLMRYDPKSPHHERYVKNPPPIEPALEERLRGDCLKLMGALGYDFGTLEFAVRDGIPYAIDFLNPAPDADVNSVGAENFEWVLDTASRWLIERASQPPDPISDYHWATFLSGGETPKSRAPRVRKPAAAPKATGPARPRGNA